MIDGIVQDENGDSLAGVEVSIAESAFKAKTDNEGRYSIDYFPGKITLLYSKDGYAPKTLEIIIENKSYIPLKKIKLRAVIQESPD